MAFVIEKLLITSKLMIVESIILLYYFIGDSFQNSW